MDLDRFDSLPDDAQLWVYGFTSNLTDEQKQIVEEAFAVFVPRWQTHGTPVQSAYTILEDQVLLVGAIAPGGMSGCSIDSSVQVLKDLRDRFGLDGLDSGRIFFRDDDGKIESVAFLEFQKYVDSDRVGDATPVLDTTITRLGELRSGGLEKSFAESWHSRSFARPA